MSVKNNSNELSITRIYDAPVKLVWDAWTDPKKVAKWWGPRGFTITTHSKDLRPGGHWSYIMHGPDGTNWDNKTIYHEVEEYKRLVYDHGGNDDRPPLFRVTVTFEEKKGKTTMSMTMAFPSPEVAKEMKGFIKKAGGNGTWDRLAEYLGDQENKNQFVINRTFEAPISTVFKMWTDSEHLSRWMPPTGMTMTTIRSEIREGGNTFFMMTDGKDITMYGNLKYTEIIPNSRIVYIQGFRDQNEKVSRHPLAPVWPEEMLVSVVLTEESATETRVTVYSEPYGKCTPEEIAMFINAREGMTMGWTGSFDKLENLLIKP